MSIVVLRMLGGAEVSLGVFHLPSCDFYTRAGRITLFTLRICALLVNGKRKGSDQRGVRGDLRFEVKEGKSVT